MFVWQASERIFKAARNVKNKQSALSSFNSYKWLGSVLSKIVSAWKRKERTSEVIEKINDNFRVGSATSLLKGPQDSHRRKAKVFWTGMSHMAIISTVKSGIFGSITGTVLSSPVPELTSSKFSFITIFQIRSSRDHVQIPGPYMTKHQCCTVYCTKVLFPSFGTLKSSWWSPYFAFFGFEHEFIEPWSTSADSETGWGGTSVSS